MIIPTPVKDDKSFKGPSSKNLDESFKKYKALDIIKEDKDDDFFRYKEDFEPLISEEYKKGLPPTIVNSKVLIDLLMNPKSAEPHLHKSKVLNLQPLAEL